MSDGLEPDEAGFLQVRDLSRRANPCSSDVGPGVAAAAPVLVQSTSTSSTASLRAADPAAAHQGSASGVYQLHRQIKVPFTDGTASVKRVSGRAPESLPLESVLSLHTTESSMSEHAGRSDDGATAVSAGTPFSPPLDANSLRAPVSEREGAAPDAGGAEERDGSDDGAVTKRMRTDSDVAAGDAAVEGVDSDVATPCFSAGARSPHYSPSAHSLPLRPKPQRLANLEENCTGANDEASKTSLVTQQRRHDEDTPADPRDAETSDTLASTQRRGHGEAGRQQKDENEEDQDERLSSTRKRPKSHSESAGEETVDSMEEVKENEELQSILPRCALPPNRGNAVTEDGEKQNGSSVQASTDVARALAAFSSSLHGTAAHQAKSMGRPALSPHHSYAPWRVPESSRREDGDQVAFLSLDGEREGISEGHTKAPPPLRTRARVESTTGVPASKPLGDTDKKSSVGGTANVGAALTTPPGGPSVEASISSDVGAISSGSYAGSGCHDADTAAVFAAMNAQAARFGGGGVLRPNPANLTFSGSGSGSQGGDATIDRSTSSHFSAPSRGATSLSPPYLAVDEENGELAIVFRRDGQGRDARHQNGGGGGLGGVRGGLPTSPTHPELNTTLDETFGTLVSTMSTTFSTTTNSAGDGDSGSPADPHRLQMAAQMRQALLQTLGLNANSGSASTGSTHSRHRSEKAASLASVAGSSAEATISSGAALPSSPMREIRSASAHSHIPRLPHLGHAVGSGAHVIATPPASSRNPSSAAFNLASSASLSTNSTTSPTAAAQSRSVAAMFAAFTTPGPHMRSAHIGGAAAAIPAFFDIDSGADDDYSERGRSEGHDQLQTSMSEEGSRTLSMSVSNPLVYDDLPSSEIGSSQPFNAAVRPPPNLQLAYPSRRHSLAVSFTDFANSRRSSVSNTPTCSNTKLNKTSDDLFSNSTSSLLPPVLKSTARGGEQSSLEAAAAEAVREVNNGNCTVDSGDDEGEGETYGNVDAVRGETALQHPLPLIVSPVAYVAFSDESEASNLRVSSNAGISPLNIEGVAKGGARRRFVSSNSAQPLAFPAMHSASSPSSEASTPVASYSAPREVNANSPMDEESVVMTPTPEATSAAVNSAAVVGLASPVGVSAGNERSDAMVPPGLEWSSHSLSTSLRVSRFRSAEYGAYSTEDDDVSGTATTRAPNSTSSSQFQIQPAGSMVVGETPELLHDAAACPINSHSRRDFVNSSASAATASAASQVSAMQPSHADPTVAVAAAATAAAAGVESARDLLLSEQTSATTTATICDLSASTSTRMWSDGVATSAAGLLRRFGDDNALEEEVESPVVPQSTHRLNQFAFVPMPRSRHGEFGMFSGDGGSPRRSSIPATQIETDEKDEVSSPCIRPATADPSGTPSSPSQHQHGFRMGGFQQQVPSKWRRSSSSILHANGARLAADVFGENVGESEDSGIQDDEDDDMWGEPTTSTQGQQQEQQPQTQQQKKVQEGEQAHPTEDDFSEPAVAPMAAQNAKHVTFADPAETQFTDPPPSPWAGSDFFYAPDYTRMEFKNVATGADTSQNNDDDESDGAAEEDAEVMRAVPHFRFTHRSVNGHGSPVPQPIAHLSAPAWAAWSRSSSGSGKPKTKVDEPHLTNSTQQQQQDEDQTTEATSPPHDDDAPSERAPRVFFTKERLAARAALMEARRAALRSTGAAATAPCADEAATWTGGSLNPPAEVDAAKQPALSSRLQISLAPPPPAALAATISVALPDFAAPVVTTASSPMQGGPTAAPVPESSANGDDKKDDNDDDDGFGGWVVQQSPASPTSREAAAPPFILTTEWCTKRAADLKKHNNGALSDVSSAVSIDADRVAEVLSNVFGESTHVLAPSPPHTNSATAPVCVNFDHNDTDETSEALGATTSTTQPTSGEIRGVDGVLEALSFISLAHRSGGVSMPGSATTTPVTTNANASHNSMNTYPAPAAEDGGYVVPWRTRTSAATTSQAGPYARSAGEAGAAGKEGDAESAPGEEDDVDDPRLRLTRHLLFPEQSERGDEPSAAATREATAVCPVSSFMGTRRLPDAPTAAQWTERDVLLAVQQEQRRMAQENEGAVETERLEDVLRMSS